MSEPDVAAINFDEGIMVLEDETVLQIDSMYDDDGEEIDDPDLAVTAIAELPDGRWLSVDLNCFERLTKQ